MRSTASVATQRGVLCCVRKQMVLPGMVPASVIRTVASLACLCFPLRASLGSVRMAKRLSHIRTSASSMHSTPPNPSLKLTRYGMRCKPGVCQFHHRHTPGLQRMPPRAA